MATGQIAEPGFEARWTAWTLRNAADDRLMRARMKIVVPLLAGLALVLIYALTP